MKEYFTLQEVAQILAVPANRISTWIKRGSVTPAFPKGPIEFTRAEVARMAAIVAIVDCFESPVDFVNTMRPGMIAGIGAHIPNSPPIGDVIVREDDPMKWRTAAIRAIREKLAELEKAPLQPATA
jgi:hypothetical protein